MSGQPTLTPSIASVPQRELKKYLSKIRRDFNIDPLLHSNMHKEDIIKYYLDSDLGYRFFHSQDGSIHMALNFDGNFTKDGYYGQSKIVQDIIDETNATNVLELSIGKGFNIKHLAENNPQISFQGFDINKAHVKIAKNSLSRLPNAACYVADFHYLPLRSASYDLVFVVESLCHATDLHLALTEARRVLKPGGRLILFDGFRRAELSTLEPDLQLAMRLTERAMAVPESMTLDKWLALTKTVGFEAVNVRNLSDAIMPNLVRFQWLARGYFKYPALNRVFYRLLPQGLVTNAIAGVLMPFTIQAGVHGYFLVVLTAV
jgi:ubiquinone/menaquinone biosynthesis C-methylase UbiE